jgi:GPH family glycoside/pentoside/hexuronide:cation symporter
LPVSVKLLYGLGGMTDSIKAVASGLYLLFFYTTVLGLPARLVGLAATISLIWDAFIDPAIGRRSDRTIGRYGRRHGWMLLGSVGMAFGFWGLFSPPVGLSNGQLFSWLVAMSLFLRTSHSMFSVPYLALGAELQPDYTGRTVIAGFRATVAQLGAIVASGVTLHLFFAAEAGTRSRLDAGNYSSMGLALGGLMGLAGLVATIGTWRHRPVAAATPSAQVVIRWRLLLRNRAFVTLASSAALFFLATVFVIGLTLYLLTNFAGLPSGQLSTCQFALHGGTMVGVVCWARFGRSYEKHRLHLLSCLTTAAIVTLGFWVRLVPASLLTPVVVTGYALAGLTSAGLLVMPASMLADVIDEDRLRSGAQTEGMFFGAFSCVYQVAIGVATVIASLLVDLYAGVVPGAATQSAMTIERIGILACLVPGALKVIAGLLILGYPLTRRRALEVRAALAAQPPPSAPGPSTA